MADGSNKEVEIDTSIGDLKSREEDIPGRLNEMYELLVHVKRGQDTLRNVFDDKIDSLRRDIISTIDDKIKAVKVDIDLSFCDIDDRIKTLENNMKTLANSTQPSSLTDDTNITILAYNLNQVQGQTDLIQAQKLVEALGADNIEIGEVVRLKSRHPNKPGPIKIAFGSLEQKISVLRKKMTIVNHDQFKDVYIRSSKTHTERVIELNAKTILKEIPNGHEFRVRGNGRIIKKTNENSDTFHPPISQA
ncbi:hypothetical protein SNE40_008869 [Patella caerulea]|uniref:Uncharacterized protein n=1 Tax=Patella caerulea TaxID=87958 RepID=A0AAN8JUH4_PATCE